MTRRDFVSRAAQAVPVVLATSCTRPAPGTVSGQRIGICDWNLGEPCDPEAIPLAASVGLNGIQVSVGTNPDAISLRDPSVRNRYLELGRAHGVSFPSVAAGGILNQIPLKSEPEAAVYVIDALEAAAVLGSTCILTAFFGDADLRKRADDGGFINEASGPFASYALDRTGVDRVVAALKQIAPRAEDLGLVIGLEDTLSARQELELIDRVGSPAVKVYYDLGNSTGYGYDVAGELRMLGADRICEIHLKETLGLDDPMTPVFGAPSSGGVDFEAAAVALRDIGYDKWFVLETGGRADHFIEDTRRNVEFATSLFFA